MSEESNYAIGLASVQSDGLMAAIKAAEARIALVYATNTTTLVDEISAADWASWDESAVCAIVSDPHEAQISDPFDLDETGLHAAA